MATRGLVFSLALIGVFGWMAATVIAQMLPRSGICSETGERMEDAAFIKAAVEEWAVGPRTYFGAGFDGSRTVPLWSSADAYLAEFPDCCEIYKGAAADWFTPPENIPALWGQEGRVVRLSAPKVDLTKGEPTITFARRFTVFDNCARVVEPD